MAAEHAIQGVVVDFTGLRLRHPDGRELRLEARTMQVLQVLSQRQGAVVSSEEILDAVWGHRHLSAHSVALSISDLRKALGDDARAPRFIETVPKRGYRLLAETTVDTRAERESVDRQVTRSAAGGAHPRPPRGLMAAMAALLCLGALAWHTQRASEDATGFAAELLRAELLWSRRDTESTLEAHRLLLRLLEQQPTSAPAHALLADLYAHKTGAYLGRPEIDSFRAAQRHLDQAIAHRGDPDTIAITQATLFFYRDLAADKALAALRDSIAANRCNPRCAQTAAMVYSAIGAHQKAITLIDAAAGAEPLSPALAWDRVWMHYLAGDLAGAETAYQRALTQFAPHPLYRALLDTAGPNAAAMHSSWADRLQTRDVAIAPVPADYRNWLALLQRGGHHENRVVTAIIAELAGDRPAALASLEQIQSAREEWMAIWLARIPALAALREEPRFQAVAKRFGPINVQEVAAR